MKHLSYPLHADRRSAGTQEPSAVDEATHKLLSLDDACLEHEEPSPGDDSEDDTEDETADFP